MAKEIEYERTFLAKRLPPEVNGVAGVLLHDVMVPDTIAHPSLRLRQRADLYVMTKKVPVHGSDSTVMSEDTVLLEKQEFEALAKCSKKDVVKRRYNVVISGYPAEVDVFEEKLSGLVLIDFEFASSIDKDSFVAPDVCLAEVSQSQAFAGGVLAGKSYEDIEPELKKYGYQRIVSKNQEVYDEV